MTKKTAPAPAKTTRKATPPVVSEDVALPEVEQYDGPELDEDGIPMGVDLTFDQVMRAQRSAVARGVNAELALPVVEEDPLPKRRKRK